MADDLHGTLVSLSEETMGDAFDTAASIGATTLSLYDVSDFDEDGGSVQINGTVYTYDTVDMDADTVHLTSGLSAAAAVDDRVDLWNTDQGDTVSERVALVSLDDQGDGDPVSVAVDHSLAPLLSRTTLAGGMSVTMQQDNSGYKVTGVHGRRVRLIQKTDALTGLSLGIDDGGGLMSGIFVGPAGDIVRIGADQDFRVKTPDGTTYIPVLASAFTVSSDSSVKTDVTDPPDALAIITAAPASCWRYNTDADGVVRIGPMADDLPEWAVQTDSEDGTRMVDLARQVGILWAALVQQTRINQALDARVTKLEKGR